MPCGSSLRLWLFLYAALPQEERPGRLLWYQDGLRRVLSYGTPSGCDQPCSLHADHCGQNSALRDLLLRGWQKEALGDRARERFEDLHERILSIPIQQLPEMSAAFECMSTK